MTGPGPAPQQFDRAGARFTAGDHAGAAQLLSKADDAGNAMAQLRLALMYDQGDGAPRKRRKGDGDYNECEPRTEWFH